MILYGDKKMLKIQSKFSKSNLYFRSSEWVIRLKHKNKRKKEKYFENFTLLKKFINYKFSKEMFMTWIRSRIKNKWILSTVKTYFLMGITCNCSVKVMN